MMHLFSRLHRDQRGAALVEFAFVAPIFLLMLMSALDIGHGLYIRAIASGTLEASARSGSLEGATELQLEDSIREGVYTILPAYARDAEHVVITTRNYTSYSDIDSAEKISVDHNDNGVLDPPENGIDEDGNGSIDPGDCWIDEDLNGEYGVNEGASGLGGADDGVYYNVTITMPRLFPFHAMLGLSPDHVITTKTLVINQPFNAQAVRPTLCLEE